MKRTPPAGAKKEAPAPRGGSCASSARGGFLRRLAPSPVLATLALVVFYLAVWVLRRARENEDGELVLKSLDRVLRAAELLHKLLG